MAYVDLNPIRAAKDNDTFTSDFTSIQQRLYDYTKTKKAHKRKSQDEKTFIERVNHQQAIQENIENELNITELPTANMNDAFQRQCSYRYTYCFTFHANRLL